MSGTPRLLGGRYEVGELLGRGGMAEVHLGYDSRLGRQVAIKLLRSDLARDPSFLGRFRREAQSAAGLNHASVVAIYDSGEDHLKDVGGAVVDVPFIVMEYVEGQTLRQYLTDRGRIEPEEASRITEGILDALAYSHRAGIVHRDIKPANVMIGPAGEIKVMDFGIARAIADSNATMTQTSAVIGTAQYLSPEQAQGLQVDARSDLYSTGCLLFELLTGRAPFVGDTPVAVAYQHVGELAPRPGAFEDDVPSALDAVVAHALVKDREGRYQDADAFRADLVRARLGRPISAAALGSAAAAEEAVATHVISRAGVGAAAAAVAGGMPTQVYAAQTAAPYDPGGNTAGLPAIGRDPGDDPEKRRVGAYVLLTLTVLAVIAVLAWGAKALFSQEAPTTPTKVSVPRVVGLQQSVAEIALTGAKLRMQPNSVADQAPVGQVISQSEDPGALVAENTIINVDVSTGPDSVTVPDVAGKTVEEATKILTADPFDFVVAAEKKPVNDSKYDKGVVDTTSPGADEGAKAGATVTLSVSTGKVTVPNVLNKSSSEAASLLADAGLNPKWKYVESDKPQGTVIGQSPKDGLLDRDSSVAIEVSIPVTPTVTTTSTPPPPPTTTTTPPPTTTTTGTPTGSPTTP